MEDIDYLCRLIGVSREKFGQTITGTNIRQNRTSIWKYIKLSDELKSAGFRDIRHGYSYIYRLYYRDKSYYGLTTAVVYRWIGHITGSRSNASRTIVDEAKQNNDAALMEIVDISCGNDIELVEAFWINDNPCVNILKYPARYKKLKKRKLINSVVMNKIRQKPSTIFEQHLKPPVFVETDNLNYVDCNS